MKNYKVKEIIFGLKDEYQKVYKDVRKLRDLVDSKELDYEIYISKLEKDVDPVILFNISTGVTYNKSDKIQTVGGKLYDPSTKEFYNERLFTVTDKKKFREQADEILYSDFITDMGMCEPDDLETKKGKINNLYIWDNLIEFTRNNYFNNLSTSVQYFAWNNKMYFETTKLFRRVNEKMINDILDEEVPEYCLKRYHKDLIESHQLDEVVINNTKPANKCEEYDVLSGEKILLLKR